MMFQHEIPRCVMTLNAYPRTEIVIGGKWIGADQRQSLANINPAMGEEIGRIPCVTVDDLAEAAEVAQKAFQLWKLRSALDRSAILRRFADLLRANVDMIARNITIDEGKPLAEALAETRSAADYVDWHAEEGRRIYGRVIPARIPGVQQQVLREPVGVCLALSPWNFPLSQAVRKVVGALGSGCTLILKGPSEAPSGIMAIAQYLKEAGLPEGCFNLVWGDPPLISETLIAHPLGKYVKRTTMELGGHAPVLVFDDANPEAAAKALTGNKLRNAGQVCIAPTRFYVQDRIYDRFTASLVENFEKVKVGNGLDATSAMGPLCHPGRITSMERLIADAKTGGAKVLTGGKRIGNEGYFFEPTIVETPDDSIALMREEPFGPVAIVSRFGDTDEGLARANGLPFGLASFVFTNSLERADRVAAQLQSGLVSINHFGLALAETPFGGINDSGYGSEGGSETFDGYLNTKFVSRMSIPVA
jgi:succinate-semialdehyde dehydrogenase / glutarate-semialdehyde dehydrogenase